MVSRALVTLAPCALALLVACPIETLVPDAGAPPDGGVDVACQEANQIDSGVPSGDCDPASGGRCDVRRFQACTWDVLADEGRCTCSSERSALGERCDLGRQNCQLGTTCLFFQGQPAPTCQAVCSFADGSGCELLRTGDRAVACAPVRRGPDGAPTNRYGICVDVGRTCEPLADDCPAEDKCTLLGRVTACGPAGSAGPGDLCSNEGCARGSMCIALEDASGNQVPPTCYVPCEVTNPTCATGQCIEIGLSFGICY